jgi:hypothetical protein
MKESIRQVIPADAEGAIEEAAPRIQPPSTGEQVEASRPDRSTGLTQAANDETAKEPDAAASVDADVKRGDGARRGNCRG